MLLGFSQIVLEDCAFVEDSFIDQLLSTSSKNLGDNLRNLGDRLMHDSSFVVILILTLPFLRIFLIHLTILLLALILHFLQRDALLWVLFA